MFNGDHLFMKLMKIDKISKSVKSAFEKLPHSAATEDNYLRGLPAIRKDLVHVEDFNGMVDRAIKHLKAAGNKKFSYYDDGYGEELVIFFGSEKAIMKAIEAEKAIRIKEGVI